MKTHFIRLKNCSKVVLFLALAIGSMGLAKAQQQPDFTVGPLDSAEKNIFISAIRQKGPEQKSINTKYFSGYMSAEKDLSGFLRYDYDQQNLMPDCQSPCFLRLYFCPGGEEPQADGGILVWFVQYLLNVRGNFIDGSFPLAVNISHDGRRYRGDIELIAHQKFPQSALEVEFNISPFTIDPDDNTIDLGLKNQSGCVIILDQPEIDTLGHDCWEDKEAVLIKDRGYLQPKMTTFQAAVRLKLRPKRLEAIRKSILPFDKKKPHASIEVLIPFQVENGAVTSIRTRLDFAFTPRWGWLLVSVCIGAGLAFIVVLLIWKRRRKEKKQKRKRTIEILKMALFTIIIGLVVYIAYYLARDNTNVVLLGFPLNPQQVLPALILGFVVGLRPLFWYQKVFGAGKSGSKPDTKRRKKLKVNKMALLILATVLISSKINAGGALFRPIALSYRNSSHVLYVVSWSPGGGRDTIYSLDVLDEHSHLNSLGKTEAVGVASDHCLVERSDGLWLATVACYETSLGQNQFKTTTRTISLMRLTKNNSKTQPLAMKNRLRGIGLYLGITYDYEQQRFLISDPIRRGIYEFKLTEKGFGAEKLVFSHERFQKPACLTWSQRGLFLADAGSGEVYKIDLNRKELRVIAMNVLSPTSLTLSPDEKKLYISDAGKAVILEANLETGSQRECIRHSLLQTPNAVAVDSNGNFWVADSGAMAIFKFSSNNQLLKTIRP